MDGQSNSKRSQEKMGCSLKNASQQLQKKQSLDHNAYEHTWTDGSTQTDNFFSPINHDFYARQPYKHINEMSRSIRLLQVAKDPATGKRTFALTEERPLSEAQDTYTAISYCASNSKDTSELLANGVRFNAFANLARAIEETCHYREIAHQDTAPLLWTDQICINQSDPIERSHQVGMMYHVYENAVEIAVCLSTAVTMHSDHGACAWIKALNDYQSLGVIQAKNYFDIRNILTHLIGASQSVILEI
jgi:hypothetical protein